MTPQATLAGSGRWSGWAQRLTRDKADTLLLLLAALLVIAPHFAHFPVWCSATVLLALAWRAGITLRGSRMPPIWLLLPISLLAMAGVFYSFRTLLGRDPGVAMLALLLTFKLLEMHARRDLFVVTFLCFFLLLTDFFYSQSILTALSMVGTIIVLLTAQITFQYTGKVPPLTQRLALAARLFLLAAPLGFLLFVGFPRIEGPLWGLPGDAHNGRTGISDTMAPGSMSNLAQSEDVAFRVRFQGTPPPQRALYWRGLVLSHYDGRVWRRIGHALPTPGAHLPGGGLQLRGDAYAYEITQEASGKRYLFPLEFSGRRLAGGDIQNGFSDELETFSTSLLGNRVRYQGTGYTDYLAQPELGADDLWPWLQLPRGYNPRTVEFAATLAELRAREGDQATIQAVLKLFRQQHFAYTLEPPELGRNAMDDFLFTTMKGFCEHYASAFVYLMRGAGLPARVVNGYQGGEFNPVDGYFTIRQSDAHAWAEVWLPQRGWVRVDPTAAVAPERINQSLGRALPQVAPFGLSSLSGLRNDRNSWLSKMRFSLSAMNNAWNQWVLDYNPTRQQNFLRELGEAFGNWRALLALLLLGTLFGWVQKQRERRRRDPVDVLWDAFCAQLARRGVVRAAHEGPHSLAQRVAEGNLPNEKKIAISAFLALYGSLKYALPQAEDTKQSVKRLTQLLNQSK